jgi:hypothetical protein
MVGAAGNREGHCSVKLKAIFRTGGAYLALQNSKDEYALIDYVQFGTFHKYEQQARESGATANTDLISQATWREDETARTPGVQFDEYADGWELERSDGETFANLDAADLLALFRARG